MCPVPAGLLLRSIRRVEGGGRYCTRCKEHHVMWNAGQHATARCRRGQLSYGACMINRYDILELEDRLQESLGRILPFEAHAIYFPQNDRPEETVWLPEENRLFLPLRRDGELLGVFTCRGMDPARVEALLPVLPAIASLCLDNLSLYKAGRLDAPTGLLTRTVLMETLNREAGAIRAAFEHAADGSGQEERGRKGGDASLGLVVVRFAGMEQLIRQAGHDFAERLMTRMAETLRETVPGQALCARSGEYEMAVLVPGGDRTGCERLAIEAVHRLQEVLLPDPYTGRMTGVLPYAGYVLFPHDMDGARFQDLGAPAATLLHKAGLAADVARALPESLRRSQVMGYGRLLAEGGCILRLLPLSCVEISLGRGEGAREGQHFSVWSAATSENGDQQPVYKGEIVLLEVRENASMAEVLHLGDATCPLRPGDALAFEAEDSTAGVKTRQDEGSGEIPGDGLYRHGDFLARLARAREGCETFALAVLRVPQLDRDSAPVKLGGILRVCRERFREVGWEPVLSGRFALNSLIFFHPLGDEAALRRVYEGLCAELSALICLSAETDGGPHAAVGAGIAIWPFLHYHQGEMVECARKALEYGLLLPEPHVGIFDSVAINISADKRHCRGDVFGALEEYRLALLADDNNALAWNSLGICMAGLGRHEEARRHFEEALKRSPDDAALTYNLGTACLRLGDVQAAREHFARCLELHPDHLYAALRLGQIAEQNGRTDEAEALYKTVAMRNTSSSLPYQSLARIALRGGKTTTAREYLHQALLRDPRDAEALMLMARLYLDGGEDAELAESLARQSVALRPDRKSGWLELARALEARGLTREARSALLKAEAL